MIRIEIKSEPFINCPAPEITEKMLDWLFLTMWSTRFEHWFKKVNSIQIRANQSYKGSGKIHFYIIINNSIKKVFYKSYDIDSPLYLQNPAMGSYFDKTEYRDSWMGKEERWEWMNYFVQRGVDMGEEGVECTRRIEERIAKHREQERVIKEKQIEDAQYQQYLKLKEKFEPQNK